MKNNLMRSIKSIMVVGVLSLMSVSCTADGDVTIKFAPGIGADEYRVEYGYISDMVKPRGERPQPLSGDYKVTNGEIKIPTLADGAAQYAMRVSDNEYIVLYTEPGDNITVNVTGISPLAYTITGSVMMTDIAKMDTESGKIFSDYQRMMQAGTADAAVLADAEQRYNAVFTDYLAKNPESKAAPYALMHLDGEDFINAYANFKKQPNNPLTPMLEAQYSYVERELASKRRQVELESGKVAAPNFTFADINGKEISLSDFRGKWVIIDFWGSWCPWCIKGFPHLKEAYKEYAGKLEILGVACNDGREAWENALKKYELPWVNVYNPIEGGGKVLEDYGVQGFPTKAIVDPEGKIRNITVGENPAFFEILSTLIGK